VFLRGLRVASPPVNEPEAPINILADPPSKRILAPEAADLPLLNETADREHTPLRQHSPAGWNLLQCAC
jgi:hypothetical protein